MTQQAVISKAPDSASDCLAESISGRTGPSNMTDSGIRSARSPQSARNACAFQYIWCA